MSVCECESERVGWKHDMKFTYTVAMHIYTTHMCKFTFIEVGGCDDWVYFQTTAFVLITNYTMRWNEYSSPLLWIMRCVRYLLSPVNLHVILLECIRTIPEQANVMLLLFFCLSLFPPCCCLCIVTTTVWLFLSLASVWLYCSSTSERMFNCKVVEDEYGCIFFHFL